MNCELGNFIAFYQLVKKDFYFLKMGIYHLTTKEGFL
ncbi:hypothetical protein SAMN04487777_1097 [Priestia aryabhattai B8W22]|nr:hypothetical protein SAMN04487777_1097 [Priestia aryabhattai B8W22]